MIDKEGESYRKPQFGDILKKRKPKEIPPLKQGILFPPQISEFNLPYNATYTDVRLLADHKLATGDCLSTGIAMQEAAEELDFALLEEVRK
jgi:hypothetical protein